MSKLAARTYRTHIRLPDGDNIFGWLTCRLTPEEAIAYIEKKYAGARVVDLIPIPTIMQEIADDATRRTN